MEKRQLFHNLVQLAAVDGKFTDEEIQFLVGKAELWGIPNDEFETSLSAVGNDTIDLKIPVERSQRIELMRQMILMMAVDGELAETEKALCAAASASMDLSTEEFTSIVESMIG